MMKPLSKGAKNHLYPFYGANPNPDKPEKLMDGIRCFATRRDMGDMILVGRS